MSKIIGKEIEERMWKEWGKDVGMIIWQEWLRVVHKTYKVVRMMDIKRLREIKRRGYWRDYVRMMDTADIIRFER